VALDLGEIPQPVLGRVPFTTWRRLHRVIEGGETACVFVSPVPLARSVGGITVALTPPVLPDVERATPRDVGLPACGGGAPHALMNGRATPRDVGLPACGGGAVAPQRFGEPGRSSPDWEDERRPGAPRAPINVELFPGLTIDGRIIHARSLRAERLGDLKNFFNAESASDVTSR
jgi:hypothetical protein